jgi:hypothetical protein
MFTAGGVTVYTAWQQWFPGELEDIESEEFLIEAGNGQYLSVE